MDEVDYNLYPKREHQLKWIVIYLEEAAKLRGTHVVISLSCLISWSNFGLVNSITLINKKLILSEMVANINHSGTEIPDAWMPMMKQHNNSFGENPDLVIT